MRTCAARTDGLEPLPTPRRGASQPEMLCAFVAERGAAYLGVVDRAPGSRSASATPEEALDMRRKFAGQGSHVVDAGDRTRSPQGPSLVGRVQGARAPQEAAVARWRRRGTSCAAAPATASSARAASSTTNGSIGAR